MKTDIDLFTPLELGPLQLANRIVLAPLTRNRAGEGNVPQAINVEYYRQRASGGLLISEASQISPQGVGYPSTPGIHSDAQVAGWKKITDAVHAEGGRIFLQLWHVGRISHPSLQPDGELPVAPSAIEPAGETATYEGMQAFVTPRALEINEISPIVSQYRQAAHNANAAGFDGVEIHAANGYLIDQFLRDGTNYRTDEYGGSLKNRVRFLIEIVKAVTAELGSERVGVRLSPENGFNDIKDGQPQETFNFIVERLNEFKLAYLHVVEGDMVTGERNLDYNQFRSAFQGIYIANNRYDFERATEALKTDAADLVSFGQLYIANPDLPERFAKGAKLNVPDPDTFYGGGEHGYTDYPSLEEGS
ncbi:MAG: alkene reductase [Gammaproteobacteria bacterium]|nr:alkene reductase [Gammaproteobacteria bacterium]